MLHSCDLFSEHTLEFDRLSGWPFSQLKPFAIWRMTKPVTISTKTAVKRRHLIDRCQTWDADSTESLTDT